MGSSKKNLSGSITHDQRCRETARSWRWLLARVTSMSFFWTIARTMDLSWSVSVGFLPWAVEDTERTVIARTTLARVLAHRDGGMHARGPLHSRRQSVCAL
jgi:hypothetical protein